MSVNDTADIDSLIKEIEHYQVNLNDPCLGSGFWDEAVKDFIAKKSGKLVSLLQELKRTRGKKILTVSGEDHHHIIVEGLSKDDPAIAFSSALSKAAMYFSTQHDFILVLKNIEKLSGGGCCARLELNILPAVAGPSAAKQPAGLKHIHDHNYGKKHKGTLEKYPIFNHFEGIEDDGQTDLPEYILINVTDHALMNYMISKRFFDAGHITWPATPAGETPPEKMIVRIRRHRMEIAS